MIDEYIEAEKPSVMQRIGISHWSARTKANEVLEDSLPRDIKAFKELVDDLERKWKEENGPVSRTSDAKAENYALTFAS